MPKRSQIRITKMKVDALSPGTQLWDSEISGFGVVANAHSKSYKLKYYHKGRQRMLTIGVHGSPLTVDQARKQALIYKAQQQSGEDPATVKQVVGVTVEALCAEYMEKHASVMKKAGSAHMDQANINNHVQPLLGKMAVSDVTSADIETFKLAVKSGKTAPDDPKAVQKRQRGGSPVKGGTGVANRCLALLSKMFNLAETWGLRPKKSNPVSGVTKFKERAKERFLTVDEINRLTTHLDKLEDEGELGMQFPVALIRLLMMTGARCGEIQTLKWSMVDIDGGWLNLPDSKTDRKSILLSKQAVKLLRGLPKVTGNPYVIIGGKDGKHLQNIRKPWMKIRSAVGLDDVRIHDLRHSFASIAAAEGIDLLTIGKMMGHKNSATTQRYAHLTDDHLRKASQSVGDALDRASVPRTALA
ncbi:tyrosine-type recombinase/integrase [Mesorhizobium silamurunense]|uniref:tyrosine-type recombinase/integrase n=1 Tax=Mesorhizobium silamurunense TaxID=499528 RepID=UPI001783A15A|nr:site-specific integrase [Mesorhizobium silamurunense]